MTPAQYRRRHRHPRADVERLLPIDFPGRRIERAEVLGIPNDELALTAHFEEDRLPVAHLIV